MIERFAQRTAQFRMAAVVAGLFGKVVLGQTADPGAISPQAAANITYTPLTEDERFHNYLHSLYSPMSLVTGAASAGWGQWRDRPREWPQGAEGFGMRYGSGYAQRITRETLIFGSASLLHEDNRYFHSTDASKGKRLQHALLAVFLARKDDGSTTFSYSRMGGMLGSSFISRAWQPNSTGSANSAMVNFSTSLGVAVGFNVAREFLPKKFPFRKR
jgi:hypothetical protein